MQAHVVDGTYELFRHYHGAPPHENASGEEVGATRAVLGSLLGMLEGGATHVGVATDHVIVAQRRMSYLQELGRRASRPAQPVLAVRRGA
jgi:hypothetical protein